MRWTRWIAVLTTLAALTAAFILVSCARGPATMTQEQKIVRGEQIAWSSGCNDCHTPGALYGAPDTTRLLSGSELGWQGPWGVSYPRNLTPDTTTGIGGWTEQQIIVAIRAGHRPDGTVLLPPMPWQNFSHMTEDDITALAAYLKSIPPIVHEMPPALPPGHPQVGGVLVLPPPPAWDAQNLPPPPSATDTATTTAH